MNFFDAAIVNLLNSFAQNFWVLDKFIVFLTNNTLIKGGMLAALLWWAWFLKPNNNYIKRKSVISILVAVLFSMTVTRILAFILPFRYRPMHHPELNFTLPFGMDQTLLEGWSSFPSDHAGLYFTIAFGLFFISKKVGIISIVYTSIFIMIPRIYVGYHYPTDLIAGAIIGLFSAYLAIKYLINLKFVNNIFNYILNKPYYAYPILFLITFQLADVFDGVREIGNGITMFFSSF